MNTEQLLANVLANLTAVSYGFRLLTQLGIDLERCSPQEQALLAEAGRISNGHIRAYEELVGPDGLPWNTAKQEKPA